MSLNCLTVVKPIAVTPSMLVSTDVPEADYAEWAAGTTYAIGDRVIVAAQLLQVMPLIGRSTSATAAP